MTKKMVFHGKWTKKEKALTQKIMKGRDSDNPWTFFKAPSGHLFSAWRSTWDAISPHGKLTASTAQQLAEKVERYYQDQALTYRCVTCCRRYTQSQLTPDPQQPTGDHWICSECGGMVLLETSSDHPFIRSLSAARRNK